jgi:hypothetical protein
MKSEDVTTDMHEQPNLFSLGTDNKSECSECQHTCLGSFSSDWHKIPSNHWTPPAINKKTISS